LHGGRVIPRADSRAPCRQFSQKHGVLVLLVPLLTYSIYGGEGGRVCVWHMWHGCKTGGDIMHCCA
jgi:hypothetical protein